MPTRFNPPPGWPPAPSMWTPPPGWQPDPSWPPLPPGWPLWVEDTPAAATEGGRWAACCIVGGAAVLLGALLPFISTASMFGYAVFNVNSGARGISAIFGAILGVLGVIAHRLPASGPSRPGTPTGLAVTLLILSGLGVFGYGGFAVAGLVGFQEPADLGYQVRVTYSPGIGLVLSVLGCMLAAAGAIGILRAAAASRRRAR